MFRMLKIYFQTTRTELAAAPPPLVCKPFVHRQPLQILHQFSAGGERGLQMETTQPGTPWTMWSRTTETTGRCDGMASHAALDNRSRRESCPVNYRTREYNRSGENVRNCGSASVIVFTLF